ncbi:MAG: hypothetical protein A3H27_06845 [Acidobacteria bacterium RIFCSPLOWO2_02_FULL_59_13]|nr:MAG: hypothetical protein A3H27_06845 [Acidobacteria bacterium RIFCSPLOWO2_02_FULL_59_13]
MPRYITSHNMACLTRQGARELAQTMRSSPGVEFLRLLGNMTDGQLLAEFEVASREVLQQWLEKLGMHYQWMARMDFEATREGFRDL